MSIRRPSLVAGIAAVTIALSVSSSAVAHTAPRSDPSKAAIVFVGGGDIRTMGIHGGNVSRLTHNAIADFWPVWSPDGTRIAWVRFPGSNCNCGPGDVWVMNADGSDRHQLTHIAGDVSEPTWSPDGTQLAFTWDYGIYVIDADGTDQHRISPADSFDFDPDWSPDGSRIAFVSRGRATFDIWAMDPDGSDRTHVSHTPGITEYDPAWSPDGARIAFSGDHVAGDWRVDAMRADGAGVHTVVDAYSLEPAWYPDGHKLAFYACGIADCGLYRIRYRGGGFEPLGGPRGHDGTDPDVRVVPA